VKLYSEKKVMIDPGHGGWDNGAAWGGKYDYLEEDDLNLIISFLLRYELRCEYRNFSIEMTREKDEDKSLIDRVLQANDWGANAFVSIHADAFHNETASGISVHVRQSYSKDGILLADKVHRALMRKFAGHTNRGIKRSDFYVLRRTRMPAVLVECEFISNPDTRRFLKEPENQIALARAIASGVNGYFV